MTRATIAGGAVAIVLVLLALAYNSRDREKDAEPAKAPPAASPAVIPSVPPPSAEARPGYLYGRITAVGGTYEGRLRWGGGNQEAFWGDYFNATREENPWIAHVPPDRLPGERRPIEIFGIEIADREPETDPSRIFMARFGDIARIEARGRDVRVTLKSGTRFALDRLEASDFDDDVRVWDVKRGVVDLASLRIQTIELLPAPGVPGRGAAPGRLHGTVRTPQGDFTGFVQWDREQGLGTDELEGRTADGKLGVRFDTIRSIARRPPDSSRVTLLDGREIALSGTRNRGIYVDDLRYGRVLVSWDAFERLDLSPGGTGGSGPAYGDFPPGRPLAGSVTTRTGRRLAGRLVFDLGESETTDTLDASSRGVDYTLPFGLIASIVPSSATVTLHNGEELRLERSGDLRQENAGMLVFAEGRQRPEYVPWSDVQQVDFARPPAMYPPLGR